MTSRIETVRRQFWAVHLTLVSIVVGLALENLFQHVRGLELADPWAAGSMVVWLQAGFMALVPLTYWVMNTQLVLAFRWDVGVFDAASNVFFLIVMNVLITMIQPGGRAAFFWTIGVGNALGSLALVHFLHRAAPDPQNTPLLESFAYQPALALAGGTVILSLPTALLLQVGVISILGASIASVLLIVLTVTLVTSFSRAWWRALRAADGQPLERTGPSARDEATA